MLVDKIIDGKSYCSFDKVADELALLDEQLEAVEDERNIYLQYFDYIGVEVTWVHKFVRELNRLQINWGNQ